MRTFLGELVTQAVPESMSVAVWSGIALYAVRMVVETFKPRKNGAVAIGTLPCSVHGERLATLEQALRESRGRLERIEQKLDRALIEKGESHVS